jgi:hypothetical protein
MRLGRFHTVSDVEMVTPWSLTPRNGWVQRITVRPRGFAFALEFRSHDYLPLRFRRVAKTHKVVFARSSRSADIPREGGIRREKTRNSDKRVIAVSPGHAEHSE